MRTCQVRGQLEIVKPGGVVGYCELCGGDEGTVLVRIAPQGFAVALMVDPRLVVCDSCEAWFLGWLKRQGVRAVGGSVGGSAGAAHLVRQVGAVGQ
jgi:hypothetical protein